ncbi:MAG: sigma-70 family RNA polymerase sigma factor [Patescibacteria group bacterium]|nr:sigma-70 family RNA polymerase sigma factor [Patescibacteria group bacterium]
MNKKKQKEFNKIYNKHIKKIYRFVYFKVDSQETAEDLTSEAFSRAWKSFSQPDKDIKNINAFLYKIAHNLISDFYRAKAQIKIIAIDDCPDIIDNNMSLEDKILLDSDIQTIRIALPSIKADYQNVIIWRYINDLSISDISKILEKSKQATRVMLHRALKALRKAMENNHK